MHGAGGGGLDCMVWGRVAWSAWCGYGDLECMVWEGWFRLHGVGGGGLDCMVWEEVV